MRAELVGMLIAFSSLGPWAFEKIPICSTALHERITVRWPQTQVTLSAPQRRELLSRRNEMRRRWADVRFCHALETGQGPAGLNRRRLTLLARWLDRQGIPEGEDAAEVSQPYPQPDKGEGRVHIYACQPEERFQDCRTL